MAVGAVLVRQTALAVCVLVVVAATVMFITPMQTTTSVKPLPEPASAGVIPAAAPAQLAFGAHNDSPSALPPTVPMAGDPDIQKIRSRALTLPVQGIVASQLTDTYTQARAAGTPHEALDIMAGRGIPVLAVEDGQVAKLFLSKPGGITLYQFDPEGQYAYYYAHLDRYAEGVREGTNLRKGQIIGYVGITGNASPDAPHLHFPIFKLGPERQWWRGTPLNPYLVWRDTRP